jgi:hypothetical protein
MCIRNREIEQGAAGASGWPIGVASILTRIVSSHHPTRHKVRKHQILGPIPKARSGWLVIQRVGVHQWSEHPAGQEDATTPWSWKSLSAISQWNAKWVWEVQSAEISHKNVLGGYMSDGGHVVSGGGVKSGGGELRDFGKSWS